MTGLSGSGPDRQPPERGLCPSGFVRTILGDIPSRALGFCQAHEHLFIQEGPAARINPALCMDVYGATLEELRAFRTAGGDALVDAQPVGSGRMAGWLARVSRDSGVRVVASTGFHRPMFYRPDSWLFSASADMLTGLFVRELTVGLYEDGMEAWPVVETSMEQRVDEVGDACPPRAGLVKVAAGAEGIPGSSAGQTRFEAAAAAAAETGAPVLVHTEEGKQGVELVRFFLARGVHPTQLIISHLDKVPGNEPAILSVLELGVWVCLDTLFRPKAISEEASCRLILSLVAKGHGHRLLLGLDVTRARMRSYGGSVGLADLSLVLLPMLLAKGLEASDVAAMTRTNPAGALSWKHHQEGVNT